MSKIAFFGELPLPVTKELSTKSPSPKWQRTLLFVDNLMEPNYCLTNGTVVCFPVVDTIRIWYQPDCQSNEGISTTELSSDVV